MFKKLFIVVSLALLGIVAILWISQPGADLPSAQGQATAPRVIHTSYTAGEEISLDSAVRFTFDRAMDTEDGLTLAVEPVLKGQWSWENANKILVFSPPATGYTPATPYTFSVFAQDTNGIPMAQAFTLTLNSVGYLEVSQVMPSDGATNIQGNAVITVIFNRPVVPLVDISSQANLPNPITISPTVDGVGEWLNTYIYQFTPNGSVFLGGQVYEVTVNEGLIGVNGAMLPEDYVFSFVAIKPTFSSARVVNSVSVRRPETTTTGSRSAFNAPLNPKIEMVFTHPMDPATQHGLYLEGPTGERPELTYEWSAGGTVVTFTPTDLLAINTLYDLIGDVEILRSANGSSLQNGYQRSVLTVPYPSIFGTNPENGDRVSPTATFSISFASPMDEASFEGKVVIEPIPAFNPTLSYYGNRLYVYFEALPSTSYTLTVLPGMQDVYGNAIEDTTVIHYSTRPYSPLLQLQVPSLVGLYSAYSPTTRLFVTHRNVSNINLTLYELALPDLAEIASRYSSTYEPDPNTRLRAWTVPANAPQNIQREKLILISNEQPIGGVEDFICQGAPARRLSLYIEARVDPNDPRPLTAYTDPSLGSAAVTTYAPGTTFWVQGGPICAEGYLWWEVENFEDETRGWVPEGNLISYFIEPLSDEALIANNAYQQLPPGAYFLTVSTPELEGNYWSINTHTLIVATVNITLKYGPYEALAWVTDMETGAPVPNTRIKFYDYNYRFVADGRTDENGLATVNLSRLPTTNRTLFAVVKDKDNFGFVADRFEYGIRAQQFGLPVDYSPQTHSVYIHTDRPIYRPDQTVYFRGIVRRQSDVTYTPMAGRVHIIITDYRSQIVHDEWLDLNEFSTFSGEFALDSEAALGNYSIKAEIQNYSAYQRFSVAEYRAPEFQVAVTPTADEVVQGETIEVMVEANYFSGGNVSNAAVDWQVVTTDYYFPYRGRGYWSFTDFDYDTGEGSVYVYAGGTTQRLIAEGGGTTDANGRFLIELPAILSERSGSQVYTIEVEVSDESYNSVASRSRVVVHQGLFYIGMTPEKYVGFAERTNRFNILTTDWSSQALPDTAVEYRIVERRWHSVMEKDTEGNTAWTWEVEEIEIADGTVTTDSTGHASAAFVAPRGGTYKIYGTARDSDGNLITSSAFMWVTGKDYVAWRQRNNNRIDLIASAPSYHVGDVAEILIPSPFQGATWALITVERQGFLHQDVVLMDTNSYVYELPITEAYAPNIFVSVVLIKGVDDSTPYTQFRVGTIQLGVDTERLVMNVEITAQLPDGVDFVGPGDTVTLDIKTTDWEGNPVSAEIGVGVSDLAVLSIFPPNSPSLLQHFYRERGLAVRTATTLTISADEYMQFIINGRKGGGGGGYDAGIVEIREDFVDTPLWSPHIVTDENGLAQITVTMPDNLTTWRVDARAVTDGRDRQMLVGQAVTDFLSTKPILIRPSTPRFMVVGDKLSFGAVVNNNTQTDQVIDVSVQGYGFTILQDVPLTQRVVVPAQSRIRVDWPIQVMDVEAIEVVFGVQSEDKVYSDASRPPLGQGANRLLPVYKYVAPEWVGTAGVLEGPAATSVTEAIVLPEYIDTTQGSLNIRLDRSLAGPMLDGLNYLQNFPHQCIEQTVSRFLPNIMTMRALTHLNQSSPELEANLREQVNFGIQRLYALQKSNGGWGWFYRDDSNPLTTAYAVIALAEAQNSGFTVESRVINKATNYLREYLTTNETRLEHAADWELNRRAFVLYALSRARLPYPSRLTPLYDLRHRLNLDAKAYLAMSMMAANPNDPRLDTLMSDFVNAATVSATGTYWDDRPDYYNWTTNTRTTALVLMAMAHYDHSNRLLPNAVRWLMVARQADAWETTQETAWAVMALTDWMVLTQELEADYGFAVRLNSQEIGAGQANAENIKAHEQLRVEIAELLTDEANRLVIAKDDGTGNLYYTAHVNMYLAVPSIQPTSRGIIVERRYHLANDEDRTPIDHARIGDEVVVTLNIIVPSGLHYVVIEDPFPAGAEAIDPRLLTTSTIGRPPTLSRHDPLRSGWGWWWFSHIELRDEKAVLYATYLPPGTYTYVYRLRMNLPGEYNVIPTTGTAFYFPEIYGRGAGMLFTVEPPLTE